MSLRGCVKERKRKKYRSCTSQVDPVHHRYSCNQITTSAKLLDTMQKSYGFSANLLKTIS